MIQILMVQLLVVIVVENYHLAMTKPSIRVLSLNLVVFIAGLQDIIMFVTIVTKKITMKLNMIWMKLTK